jgi:hypothetical protein
MNETESESKFDNLVSCVRCSVSRQTFAAPPCYWDRTLLLGLEAQRMCDLIACLVGASQLLPFPP